jgi:hypothetical protein
LSLSNLLEFDGDLKEVTQDLSSKTKSTTCFRLIYSFIGRMCSQVAKAPNLMQDFPEGLRDKAIMNKTLHSPYERFLMLPEMSGRSL